MASKLASNRNLDLAGNTKVSHYFWGSTVCCQCCRYSQSKHRFWNVIYLSHPGLQFVPRSDSCSGIYRSKLPHQEAHPTIHPFLHQYICCSQILISKFANCECRYHLYAYAAAGYVFSQKLHSLQFFHFYLAPFSSTYWICRSRCARAVLLKHVRSPHHLKLVVWQVSGFCSSDNFSQQDCPEYCVLYGTESSERIRMTWLWGDVRSRFRRWKNTVDMPQKGLSPIELYLMWADKSYQ